MARPGDTDGAQAYFLSKDFALAAFKGQKLTLRDWNLQLRQPILLADGRNVVSVSPQEGFMHQFSELDTLASTDRRRNAISNENRAVVVARRAALRRRLGATPCDAFVSNEKGNTVSVIDARVR